MIDKYEGRWKGKDDEKPTYEASVRTGARGKRYYLLRTNILSDNEYLCIYIHIHIHIYGARIQDKEVAERLLWSRPRKERKKRTYESNHGMHKLLASLPPPLTTTHFSGRIMTGTAFAMQKFVSQLASVVIVMHLPRRRWGKISAETTHASGPHYNVEVWRKAGRTAVRRAAN
jgi:hypothetical protein